jgi:hypothetical protein
MARQTSKRVRNMISMMKYIAILGTILPVKAIVTHLVKKFSAFYGSRRITAVLKRARYVIVS